MLLLAVAGCGAEKIPETSAPPQAEVVTLLSADASVRNEYTASLEGKVNVDIRAQVDGNLESVLVDEGAYVAKGQPLFRINDLPYREELNSAVARLHAAQAAISIAQLEIDKVTPLVQGKVVSDIQLKTARNSYQLALANAEQAKAAVATARINLGYTTVRAPVSGYIGRLARKQGSLVSRTDAEPLTNLSDIRDVYAYFSLSEADFIRFKQQYPGETLDEKLRAMPPVTLLLADNSLYPEKGRVTMVNGQFDKTTGAITLRASFPNAQGLLRSGNTGRVQLAMDYANALSVPAEATVEVQDKMFVYVVGDSNKVSRQPIAVSGKSGNAYLVAAGVKAGDRIVVSGLDRLQEGAVIRPVAPAQAHPVTVKN